MSPLPLLRSLFLCVGVFYGSKVAHLYVTLLRSISRFSILNLTGS